MKYFSEKTKKIYNSVSDLEKAETKFLKKQEEEEKKKNLRATRAKEVETAMREASEAREKANKLLIEFNKDYGSFHMSLDGDIFPFTSFFDLFF